MDEKRDSVYEAEGPIRRRRKGYDHTNCHKISHPQEHNNEDVYKTDASDRKTLHTADSSESASTTPQKGMTFNASPQEQVMSYEDRPRRLNGPPQKPVTFYSSPPQKLSTPERPCSPLQFIRRQQQASRRKRGVFETNPHDLIYRLSQTEESDIKIVKFSKKKLFSWDNVSAEYLWPIFEVIFKSDLSYQAKQSGGANDDVDHHDDDGKPGGDDKGKQNDSGKETDEHGHDYNIDNGDFDGNGHCDDKNRSSNDGDADDVREGACGDDDEYPADNASDEYNDDCVDDATDVSDESDNASNDCDVVIDDVSESDASDIRCSEDESEPNSYEYDGSCSNEDDDHDYDDKDDDDIEDMENEEANKPEGYCTTEVNDDDLDGNHGNEIVYNAAEDSYTAKGDKISGMLLERPEMLERHQKYNNELSQLSDVNNNVDVSQFDSTDDLCQNKQFETGRYHGNELHYPSVGVVSDNINFDDSNFNSNNSNKCGTFHSHGYIESWIKTAEVAMGIGTVAKDNTHHVTGSFDSGNYWVDERDFNDAMKSNVIEEDSLYSEPIKSPTGNKVNRIEMTSQKSQKTFELGGGGPTLRDIPPVYTNEIIVQVSSDDLSESDVDENFMPSSDMDRVRRVSKGDMRDLADLKVMTQKLKLDHRRPSLVAWKEKNLPKVFSQMKHQQSEQDNNNDLKQDDDTGQGRTMTSKLANVVKDGKLDNRGSSKKGFLEVDPKKRLIHQKALTPPTERAFIGGDLQGRPRSSSFKSPSKHSYDYTATLASTRSLESLQNYDRGLSRRSEVCRSSNMLDISEVMKTSGRTGSKALMSSNGSLPSIQEERVDSTGAIRNESERRKKVDDTIGWIQNELQEMRVLDCTLAKKLLRLREEIHHFRLQRCYEQQKEMIEDAFNREHELEIEKSFNVGDFDLPERLFSPELRQVGITRMNITSRRFSVF